MSCDTIQGHWFCVSYVYYGVFFTVGLVIGRSTLCVGITLYYTISQYANYKPQKEIVTAIVKHTIFKSSYATAITLFKIGHVLVAAPTIPLREVIESDNCAQHSSDSTLVAADEYASSFRSRMSRAPPWRQEECLEHPTEVLDFLYLGNMENALDKELLERMGITHIVNCVGRYAYNV